MEDSWWKPKDNRPYSIGKAYKAIKNQGEKILWDRIAWNRLSLPKHRIILWLAIQSRLQTRDRLIRFGYCTTDTCLLCDNHAEQPSLLFFRCHYSSACWNEVLTWLGVKKRWDNFENFICWMRKRSPTSRVRKAILYTAAAAVVYGVWHARNQALWHNAVPTIDNTVKEIQVVIKSRVKLLSSRKISNSDRDWLEQL